MTHRHITKSALDAEKRQRGRIFVWNNSRTTELTMAVMEAKFLSRRFFFDIYDAIPDEDMGNLLLHLRDQGVLYDTADLRQI